MLSQITDFDKVTDYVGEVRFGNGCRVQISVTDFIDENIKKLESRVDELTKDNASLIFESKNNEARIKNLTKNYTAMKDLYEGANFRNMELAKELEEASKKSDELYKEIDSLHGCINYKNKVIEDLFNDRAKLRNMLEKYEKGCPTGASAKVPSNDAVDAFRYSLDNLKKGCDLTCEIEMTRIDWARIHAAGISEVMENPFTDLDFSDHKTLNAFFKEYFKVSRWTKWTGDPNTVHVSRNNDFKNMVDALEDCMYIFKDEGKVSLGALFYEWNDSGDIGELQPYEDEELSRYQWNNEHPFSYTIMSCKDEDDSLMQYYVVFNSAPEYVDEDESED